LPPAGGGFRLSSEPLEIMGYDIPVGTVVTADPRIGNLDPTIFPDPLEFAPERWATSEAVAVSKCPMSKFVGQATSLPRGAWFPGGTGQHQCPGVPLAELTTRIMVTKWVERFSSWEEVNGPPEFIPVPIKIPKDSYQVRVVKRSKVRAAASS
jgi:cytochrome P450